MTLFRDRQDAGRQLAQAVVERTPTAGPADMVLALPRGGVPVAAAVARAVGAPLDVIVVRKLGAPGHEELAMGAIAAVTGADSDSAHDDVNAGERDGVTTVLNDELIRALGVGAAAIERVKEGEKRELLRRERVYRADRGPLQVEGRRVIVVDDGVATGATMLAAARAVRRAGAAAVTLAVPVAPSQVVGQLEAVADAVVCLHSLPHLQSVGQWYRDFSQTSDDEVITLLGRHVG